MSPLVNEESSGSSSDGKERQASSLYSAQAVAGISLPMIEEWDLRLSPTDSSTLVDEDDLRFSPTASSTLIDDRIDRLRRLQLKKRFTSELIDLIYDEDFEYGIGNRIDELVKQQMSQDALVTKVCLSEIYCQHIDNVPVLVGLLRIVARLDDMEVHPEGQMMAQAALAHKEYQVQKCGVRAFESWGTLKSLRILENLKVGNIWLQDYIDQVVADLKERHNANCGQKD